MRYTIITLGELQCFKFKRVFYNYYYDYCYYVDPIEPKVCQGEKINYYINQITTHMIEVNESIC